MTRVIYLHAFNVFLHALTTTLLVRPAQAYSTWQQGQNIITMLTLPVTAKRFFIRRLGKSNKLN